MTASVVYKGGLRTEATHIRSGQIVITDAPPDNQGKGEAFSPTDLLATSLATCMVTIMGISARERSIPIEGTKLEVTKHMTADPRRVAAIDIVVTMPDRIYASHEMRILEAAAKTCPVSYSLHPDIKQNIHFIWKDPNA